MQKFMQILATLALLLVLALEASEREVNKREKETES